MDVTGSAGPPHDGLFLVIPHLALFELLAMSEVCVSLRDAVMTDVLPWMNITVQDPLNLRLSDEILLKFTSKSNGRLTTLALINCVHVTDNGLQRVIQTNPFINKLYIPACTGLSPEGIIRALSGNENSCLERLRIHGIRNMKKEHLVALNSFLGMNSKTQQQQQPVMFDGNYEMDHNHVIDVESCSKCNEVRMVFDCTRKACKCRGCEFCIPRCVECGGCIKSQDMEEAVSACAHNLCLDCWFKLPKCSFCNKPYCRLHANQWCTGHICYVCHERFIHNLPSHA